MTSNAVLRLLVPLGVSTLAALLLLPAAPAHAICTPAPANDVIAICSGITIDQSPPPGYGANAFDATSVTILPGALVRTTSLGGAGGITFNSIGKVVNYGTIAGPNDGINAQTFIHTLVNYGSIVGSSDDAVQANGDIHNLINYGTIRGGGAAVYAQNTLHNLINYGIIELTNPASMAGAVGDTNHIVSITNYGVIIAANGIAIREFGSGDTQLTLQAGSNIQGAVDLGGGVNTLNVGNGLSIVNTFVIGPRIGFPDATLPVIGTTFGAPFAISGNQIAVVDPTNLAAQQLSFVDLTGGIFSTVENRMSSLRNGAVSGVTAARPMVVGYKDGGDTADAARQYWLQGFGSFRDQTASAPAVGFENRLGGVVSGLDAARSHMTQVGLFLGGSWGKVEADFNSQKTEADSFFGGLYATTLRSRTAIDMALTLGFTGYDHERRIANNLAPGGLEQATASYDGVFVSPEITFTRPLWSGEHRFEKSLTLRYGGLFLDGFTEAGTAAPLTVADRDLHILQARGQILLPYEVISADGTAKRAIINFGVEGRGQFGDNDVTATLLGHNLIFNPGGDDAVAGLFGGLRLEHETKAGSLLYAAIEGQADSDDSHRVSGKAGFRIRF